MHDSTYTLGNTTLSIMNPVMYRGYRSNDFEVGQIKSHPSSSSMIVSLRTRALVPTIRSRVREGLAAVA